MSFAPARSRPLHSIRPAVGAALWLLATMLMPAVVAAETPEETQAYLESFGFACEPSADLGGIACERQFGSADTDRDQASLFAFGTGRSAGVGRASYGEPWDVDIESVAVHLVEAVCPGLGARVPGIVAEARAATPPQELEELVGPCRLRAEVGSLATDGGPYRSVGVEIFNEAPVATTQSAPPIDPGDGPRGRLLTDLLSGGWTCVHDALEADGRPYAGTECRSSDADPRDQDIVRIADEGAVGVRSGVLGSSMAPALAPWSPALDAIAVDIFEMACPGSSGRIAELIAGVEAGQDAEIEVPPCFLDAGRGGTMVGDDERVRTYLVSVVSSEPFAAGPDPSVALPSAAPVPTGPGSGPLSGAGDQAALPAFTRAIPSPAEVVTDPSVVATSAILAVLAVLLVPFPGMLFNSTLETNYDEVRGWFRRGRRRRPTGVGGMPLADASAAPAPDQPTIGRGFWASPLGLVAFLLLSAVLYGFLDPGFGTGPATVPMFIGTVLGLAAVSGLAFAGPWLGHVRRGERGRFRALPGTLVVATACVLISRLTGFLPGYLYGLLIALEFARSLGRDEGRLAAISAATLLMAAGLAWLALAVMPSDGSDALGAIARTALASIVVAGLEGVVFGLVPLRFLPGSAVFAWSRIGWGVLYGIGVFGFLHVLLDPAGGYMASSARTPLFTIVALLVGFGVVSVAFWGYFRFRPDRAVAASQPESGQSEPPPG